MNRALKHLDLTRNAVGDAGAKAIAQMLQLNTALESISLDLNAIGEAGARELLASLQYNTALTRLTLEHNSRFRGEAPPARAPLACACPCPWHTNACGHAHRTRMTPPARCDAAICTRRRQHALYLIHAACGLDCVSVPRPRARAVLGESSDVQLTVPTSVRDELASQLIARIPASPSPPPRRLT